MRIRWQKNDQYLPPTMRLFKVGQVIETDDLGVSDQTALEWIAGGYAVRLFVPEPFPEPIEEGIPTAASGEADSTGSSKYKRRKKIGG